MFLPKENKTKLGSIDFYPLRNSGPIPGPDQSNPSVAIKMKEVILVKTASLVCVTRCNKYQNRDIPIHHDLVTYGTQRDSISGAKNRL